MKKLLFVFFIVSQIASAEECLLKSGERVKNVLVRDSIHFGELSSQKIASTSDCIEDAINQIDTLQTVYRGPFKTMGDEALINTVEVAFQSENLKLSGRLFKVLERDIVRDTGNFSCGLHYSYLGGSKEYGQLPNHGGENPGFNVSSLEECIQIAKSKLQTLSYFKAPLDSGHKPIQMIFIRYLDLNFQFGGSIRN